MQKPGFPGGDKTRFWPIKLRFSEIFVFSWNIHDENNIAKLVVDNALCEEIVAIGCQLSSN